MDFIYTAIIDRFNNNQALFTDVNLQPIKHFDLFKGQYIYPELHLPYKRPAIFYAYLANWKSRSGKLDQEGTLQVRLHIELENYGQSFGHSQNRDYALQIFEYHKRINALVHGWDGNHRRRHPSHRIAPISLIRLVMLFSLLSLLLIGVVALMLSMMMMMIVLSFVGLGLHRLFRWRSITFRG